MPRQVPRPSAISCLNKMPQPSTRPCLDMVVKDVKEEKLHDKGWLTQTCVYTISKAAVNAYTRIMAKSHPTLLINYVCPGLIKSDMTCENNTSINRN